MIDDYILAGEIIVVIGFYIYTEYYYPHVVDGVTYYGYRYPYRTSAPKLDDYFEYPKELYDFEFKNILNYLFYGTDRTLWSKNFIEESSELYSNNFSTVNIFDYFLHSIGYLIIIIFVLIIIRSLFFVQVKILGDFLKKLKIL